MVHRRAQVSRIGEVLRSIRIPDHRLPTRSEVRSPRHPPRPRSPTTTHAPRPARPPATAPPTPYRAARTLSQLFSNPTTVPTEAPGDAAEATPAAEPEPTLAPLTKPNPFAVACETFRNILAPTHRKSTIGSGAAALAATHCSPTTDLALHAPYRNRPIHPSHRRTQPRSPRRPQQH